MAVRRIGGRSAAAAAAEGDKRPNSDAAAGGLAHPDRAGGASSASRRSSSTPARGIRGRGRRDSPATRRWTSSSACSAGTGRAGYQDGRGGGTAADGHDHWHVQGVVTYETWKLNDATDTARRGGKTGFCFLDSEPWNLSVPVRGPIALLPGIVVRRSRVDHEPSRSLGRMGRQLPVVLRVPVDRHHRASGRHVPGAGDRRHPGLLRGADRDRQLRLGEAPHPSSRLALRRPWRRQVRAAAPTRSPRHQLRGR